MSSAKGLYVASDNACEVTEGYRRLPRCTDVSGKIPTFTDGDELNMLPTTATTLNSVSTGSACKRQGRSRRCRK